jgi:hypothetical protein
MLRTGARTAGPNPRREWRGELGLPEPERGEPPPIDSCRFPLSDQFFLHSFEAPRRTCAAARSNQVPVGGVEYFQVDGIGELVRVPV